MQASDDLAESGAMGGVLQFYQGFISPVVRNGIPLLAILLLWLGLRRAGLTPAARRAGLAATAIVLAWYLAMDALGRSGWLAAHWAPMRPLCWLIALFWLIPLTRSTAIRAALDASPRWWLLAAQLYRLGGGFVWFATLAAAHRLPSAFALTAGIGDCLTGILAVVAASCVYADVRGARRIGIAWNVFGLLDFATGFTLATLLPNTPSYPSALMISAVLAPLSADLHVLSLWQLARAGRRDRAVAAAALAV
jgi:hypothetical protein